MKMIICWISLRNQIFLKQISQKPRTRAGYFLPQLLPSPLLHQCPLQQHLMSSLLQRLSVQSLSPTWLLSYWCWCCVHTLLVVASLQSAVGSQMRMVDSLVEVNAAQARMDVAPARVIVAKEILACARMTVVLDKVLAAWGELALEQILVMNIKLMVAWRIHAANLVIVVMCFQIMHLNMEGMAQTFLLNSSSYSVWITNCS